VLVANKQIEYRNYAIDVISGYGEDSLEAQFEILVANKYTSATAQEAPEFVDARDLADVLLQDLSESARVKADEFDKLIQGVSAVCCLDL
jgi:hypothetical protein